MKDISLRKAAGAVLIVLVMYFTLTGMMNRSYAANAPVQGSTDIENAAVDGTAAVSTNNANEINSAVVSSNMISTNVEALGAAASAGAKTAQTVGEETVTSVSGSGIGVTGSATGQGVSSDTAATLPMIYALKSMAGSVDLAASEAVDVSAVSEHLEENLVATVDASDGVAVTEEQWANAVATVAWDETPVGYDDRRTDKYSFTWSGVIAKGSIVFSDAAGTKTAAVPQDVAVTVQFTVSPDDSVSNDTVSGSRAPTTGDDFMPGKWIYFIIIGVVVVLCSYLLYRDVQGEDGK
ncbi:MAG: hypothetical protein IJT96_03480 [Lachnospiraceae bacterium]|nr:hypothetical protein [Lachnospiraceae bacterium]